jgi:site-specific DNA-methyltransferase (adenine-specific)
MIKTEHLSDAVTLHLGDCRDVIPTFYAAGAVDAVIADLPYGTTQNKWDSVLPLGELWKLYWLAAKSDAAIVLTSAQPFTTALISSQIEHFRYGWIWQKSRPTGHMNAKKQPMREHEDVCVFYRDQPTYNPQFTVGKPNHVGSKARVKSPSGNYGKQYEVTEELTTRKYPKTILPFPVVSPTHVVHPTQKPLALMQYMVRTYTDEGQVVLDNTMGSGTTGVAAVSEARRFIGIEIELKYFDIARRRISEALARADLFLDRPARTESPADSSTP